MLVLTRKPTETIVIDVPPSTTTTRIEVKVVSVIKGDRVRLGTTAPKCCPVHRSEVAEAIAKERGAA